MNKEKVKINRAPKHRVSALVDESLFFEAQKAAAAEGMTVTDAIILGFEEVIKIYRKNERKRAKDLSEN